MTMKSLSPSRLRNRRRRKNCRRGSFHRNLYPSPSRKSSRSLISRTPRKTVLILSQFSRKRNPAALPLSLPENPSSCSTQPEPWPLSCWPSSERARERTVCLQRPVLLVQQSSPSLPPAGRGSPWPTSGPFLWQSLCSWPSGIPGGPKRRHKLQRPVDPPGSRPPRSQRTDPYTLAKDLLRPKKTAAQSRGGGLFHFGASGCGGMDIPPRFSCPGFVLFNGLGPPHLIW